MPTAKNKAPPAGITHLLAVLHVLGEAVDIRTAHLAPKRTTVSWGREARRGMHETKEEQRTAVSR